MHNIDVDDILDQFCKPNAPFTSFVIIVVHNIMYTRVRLHCNSYT